MNENIKKIYEAMSDRAIEGTLDKLKDNPEYQKLFDEVKEHVRKCEENGNSKAILEHSRLENERYDYVIEEIYAKGLLDGYRLRSFLEE